MTREALYDAITGVRDELVEEAGRFQPVRRIHWGRWTAAAALVLAVGLGGAGLMGLLPIGGSAGGGAGHADGSSVFMSYAGPVFPLGVLEGETALTAVRDLTWDFSPWQRVWVSNEDQLAQAVEDGLAGRELEQIAAGLTEQFPDGGYYRTSTDVLVRDGYTLTNPTDTDKTVTLTYPFASSLTALAENRPILTVDGAAAETALLIGPYSGGFTGAWGAKGPEEGSVNLAQLNSWEGYQALLAGGTYLDAAQAPWPDLSGVQATVYAITDPYGPEPEGRITNPTLAVSFDLDYDETTVLTYGFHGGTYDREKGFMRQSFSIPREGNPRYGSTFYLIVVGEDIGSYTIQGYRDGGCDAGGEIDGVTAEVERYTCSLEEILRPLAENWRGQSHRAALQVDFETYYGAVKELLVTCGVLGEDRAERYDTGWLEDLLGEAASVDRVCYLTAAVTVPAGGSLQVEADMTKAASLDFTCAHSKNRGIYGYDMVTQAGSALSFTGLTARLEHADGVEIVRQNCGFDLAAGVIRVDLEASGEHYYLEVRRAEARSG